MHVDSLSGLGDYIAHFELFDANNLTGVHPYGQANFLVIVGSIQLGRKYCEMCGFRSVVKEKIAL